MLVTSQLPIQTTKTFYSFLTRACAPHFEKGSATHDSAAKKQIFCEILFKLGQNINDCI